MAEKTKKSNYSLRELGNHKGRLSRKIYLFHILILLLVVIFVALLPKIVLYAFTAGLISIQMSMNITLEILPILSKGINLLAIYILIYSTIKRLHDVGQSGWVSILLFIPFLNFLFVFILLLVGGNKGTNKYGDDPITESAN